MNFKLRTQSTETLIVSIIAELIFYFARHRVQGGASSQETNFNYTTPSNFVNYLARHSLLLVAQNNDNRAVDSLIFRLQTRKSEF